MVTLSAQARVLMGAVQALARMNDDPVAAVRVGESSAQIAAIVKLASAGAAQARLSVAGGSAHGTLVAGGPGASMSLGSASYGPSQWSSAGHEDVFANAYGSDGNDVISISAFSTDPRPDSRAYVRVQGNGGNDVISVESNGDVNVSGGDGDDVIVSRAYNPKVFGLSLSGDAGNDTITVLGAGAAYGGDGNDVIILDATNKVGSGVTYGHGGDGDDVIVARSLGVFAYGGAGNDTIIGASQVLGSAGDEDDTVALSNSAYSTIYFRPGFGHDVVTLSDPASGVGDQVRLEFQGYSYDNNGIRFEAKPADADGNFEGSFNNYLNVLPTEGQAGYGLAHSHFDFRGISVDQVESSLSGTNLTLRVRDTGDSVLIRNYQPGRVTFSFMETADRFVASRMPPGLKGPVNQTS